jgi:cysteine-rich repeat protein
VFLLIGAGQALAGFGGSATPDFPPTVDVGDTNVSVGLDLLPNITGDDTGPVVLEGITMIPACGEQTGTGTCANTEWDPGVFSVSATGTGADNCTGINFTITETDPSSGEVTFTPDATIMLDSLQNCRINFTIDVNQVPTNDSNVAAGIQTAQEAKFSMTKTAVQVGTGSGSDETQVIGCGDSVIGNTPGETCDPPGQPGPGPQPGTCRNGGTADQCTYCGDGVLQAGAGEECDDGNGVENDGCDNNCLIETCGVLVDKGVDCGSGQVDVSLVAANDDGTNGCSANNGDTIAVGYQVQNTGNVDLVNCNLTDSNGAIIAPAVGTVAVGVTTPILLPTNAPLTCSDNLDAGEPDTATVVCECGAPQSGLGQVQAFDTADFECLAICGDGNVDPGETCDPPGSTAGGNGNLCRGDCTVCGDSVVDAGEQCDDGNGVNGDGCDNDCTIPPTCGDGFVDPALGETCDPPGSPAGANNNICRQDCTVCGDGVLDSGEQCDDGNSDDGDGCSNLCESEDIPVPTMNEWGMILFMVFAGVVAVYYLRRKRLSS